MVSRAETRRLTRTGLLLAFAALIASAQQPAPTPLEQVSARAGKDLAPAMEGETVLVRGTVSYPAIRFDLYSHLAIEDEADHGLVLEGNYPQLAAFKPGDRVEARGAVSKRGGLPVLAVGTVRKLSHGPAPAIRRVAWEKLLSFEYLGLLVSTDAPVVEKGEDSGGEYLFIGNQKRSYKVSLPLPSGRSQAGFDAFEVGDKVHVTGVASQFCPRPPYDHFFQLVVSDRDDVTMTGKKGPISPELFAVCLVFLGIALGLWWLRERRMATQREILRTFYALGEETIGAGSAIEIHRRLSSTLPAAVGVTGVHLYLYNRTAKTLDRITSGADEPFSLAVYAAEGSLPLGAAACFRNQALLTIPDTRTSPFLPDGRDGAIPGAVMFVPMFADTEIVGVLELFSNRPLRDFSPDEKVLAQHLGNQIAIALRLMEEKNIREQLFRSEKLAAVGQLVSGVAAELKTPLEAIARLTDAASAWEDLPAISAEAHKASDIVARLVSLVQPDRSDVKRVELNALLHNLVEFRRAQREPHRLSVEEELCPGPVYVLGSPGQLERVFLDLLIHSEQSLAETQQRTITIATSLLARRAIVEMRYGVNPLKTSLAAGDDSRSTPAVLPGEAVTRGIIRGHGGDLRLIRSEDGECRLEVEFPVAPAQIAAGAGASRQFTCLVVDPDIEGRDDLIRMLTGRGCRVIPATGAEDGSELVQRLRFEIVFCSIRLPGLNWLEFADRIRPKVAAFVVLAEGFDFEVSRGLFSADTVALAKPVSEAELESVLESVASRIAAGPSPRQFQLIRPDRTRKVAHS